MCRDNQLRQSTCHMIFSKMKDCFDHRIIFQGSHVISSYGAEGRNDQREKNRKQLMTLVAGLCCTIAGALTLSTRGRPLDLYNKVAWQETNGKNRVGFFINKLPE